MPADYNGRWEMVSNENFEDVMKALGEFLLPTQCIMANCKKGRPRLVTLREKKKKKKQESISR